MLKQPVPADNLFLKARTPGSSCRPLRKIVVDPALKARLFSQNTADTIPAEADGVEVLKARAMATGAAPVADVIL